MSTGLVRRGQVVKTCCLAPAAGLLYSFINPCYTSKYLEKNLWCSQKKINSQITQLCYDCCKLNQLYPNKKRKVKWSTELLGWKGDVNIYPAILNYEISRSWSPTPAPPSERSRGPRGESTHASCCSLQMFPAALCCAAALLLYMQTAALQERREESEAERNHGFVTAYFCCRVLICCLWRELLHQMFPHLLLHGVERGSSQSWY